MKRNSFFRKIIAVAFATTIVFTVSVREVHYLFSQHEAHEHCENHLHATDHHNDCSVCKFDISVFSDAIVSQFFSNSIFSQAGGHWLYQSPITNSLITFVSLRGPPSLA